MATRTPRLAARALILHQDRLLLVNAFPGGKSDLWCAPGGGVESGSSLPDNLAREVYEECGLRVAVGIMDPVDTNDSSPTGKAYQENPRTESEITYQFDLAGAKIYSWVNGSYQTSDNTDSTVDTVTSKGVGYGVQAKLAGFSVTASGFQAEGMNPFFSNNAGEAILREVDSDGYLLQGSYTWGKNRVALSYGKTEDDGNGLGVAADYETRGIAYFRTINDNLKLVAEYNQYQIDAAEGSGLNEDTDTFAVGAVLTW